MHVSTLKCTNLHLVSWSSSRLNYNFIFKSREKFWQMQCQLPKDPVPKQHNKAKYGHSYHLNSATDFASRLPSWSLSSHARTQWCLLGGWAKHCYTVSEAPFIMFYIQVLSSQSHMRTFNQNHLCTNKASNLLTLGKTGILASWQPGMGIQTLTPTNNIFKKSV